MSNNKITYISGPINLVRIEGKINNFSKVFYFFFDVHLSEDFQMECQDLRGMPIKQFLVKKFDEMKNKNKEYDFFLETFPDFYKIEYPQLGIYLRQLRKLFSQLFQFDFKKNIALKSPEFPNLRLHYMDIRSYLNSSPGNPFGLRGVIDNYYNSLNVFYPEDLFKLRDGLNLLAAEIYALHQTIYQNTYQDGKPFLVKENISDLSNYTKEDYQNIISYIINKLMKNYQNEVVKQTILNYINNELFKSFNDFFTIYDEVQIIINKFLPLLEKPLDELVIYKNKTFYQYMIFNAISFQIKAELSPKFDELFNIEFTKIKMVIMDLYFLRRALDKNYITNGIIYTGAAHSVFYINFIIKYFDFEITNLSYGKYDINDINEDIKTKNLSETEQSEILYPNKLTQCINISSFPNLFD